jgi:insertion element IS1 protein InsB
MRSCAMGMPPMASKSIAVTPTKNEAACVASPARLGSLGQPCPVGSKKSSSASSLTYNPARSRPRGSHFHCTGTGRTDGSFVLKKARDSWIWIALCRKTRQVVAYAQGDRSNKTCQRLWEAIPAAYRQRHCFTDFWAAYKAVIPEEQHTAVGKETGETAHVERWNNTLRQRLARFVRMTLSFSKSEVMHEACLLLFLHRYNLDRAILLK